MKGDRRAAGINKNEHGVHAGTKMNFMKKFWKFEKTYLRDKARVIVLKNTKIEKMYPKMPQIL